MVITGGSSIMEYNQQSTMWYKRRILNACKLIAASGINYKRVGITGEFANGRYNPDSLVQVVLVFQKSPEPKALGTLYKELKINGCELLLLSLKSFDNPNRQYSEDIKRSYKEIYCDDELAKYTEKF
jgi:hypothetical protein